MAAPRQLESVARCCGLGLSLSASGPTLGLILTLGLVVGQPSAAAAGPTVAVVRTHDGIGAFEQAIDGLQAGVADADWVEESLRLDADRWPRIRDKLGRREPAVWVPVGPLALKAAAGLEDPLVFVMVATPEKSLPDGPGPNVAGVTLRLDPVVQLRQVRRFLPEARRLGVLYDPSNEVSVREVEAARQAAEELGLELVDRTISDPGQLGRALTALLDADIDALWLVADRTVTPAGNTEAFKFIAETTARSGVPVVGYATRYTQAGALLSIGPDFGDIGAQAAEIVQRVIDGTPPAEIGIQSPRKPALSVNTRVAEALGITLPAEAVASAKRF